jgi:hypothetical protein
MSTDIAPIVLAAPLTWKNPRLSVVPVSDVRVVSSAPPVGVISTRTPSTA